MTDSKLSKPCSVEDAIRYLHVADDAAPYVVQCGNLDPEFPRRFVFGQLHVVPLQLAYFLIDRGLGHLLEDGPAAYLLEIGADTAHQDDEDEDDEDDDDEDDDDEREESDPEDAPPRRRSARRRRR